MASTRWRWIWGLLAAQSIIGAGATLAAAAPAPTTTEAAARENDADLAQRLSAKVIEALREGRHEEALHAIGALRLLTERAQRRMISVPGATSPPDEVAALKSPVTLDVGGRQLKVHFGSNTLYRDPFRRLPETTYRFIGAPKLAVEDGGRLAIQNRYVKVDDATKSIQYASSDPTVLKIDAKGELAVVKPGLAELTVSVENESVRLPFRVVEFPVEVGASADDVVGKLGIPDGQLKRYIRWLDSDTIDGIFYYASGNDGLGIAVEHWRYRRFPNAVLRFDIQGKVQDCVQPEWDRFRLEHYRLEKGR